MLVGRCPHPDLMHPHRTPSPALAAISRKIAALLKLLQALDQGRLPMHPDDYRDIVRSVAASLRTVRIDELTAMARGMPGMLGELAENEVFDRACCLTMGERRYRQRAEKSCDALLARLCGPGRDA